jgi:glycine/D-amino acid oxidase-like deaminating enzyme
MQGRSAEVVICGAGIAGIAAAYHLTVRRGVAGVILVDPQPPMSVTSDKSTECYRNWWPGPGDGMVRLMNRSIDLLEALAQESGNVFHLNRRGYLYATASPARAQQLERLSAEISALGAGPLRRHPGEPGGAAYVPAPAEGFEGQPTGADFLADPALIHRSFPYLSERTLAVLHARRCGWFSAQQYGMYMLEGARARGARLIQGRVEGVEVAGGRVRAVRVRAAGAVSVIATPTFVNAAGPWLGEVGRLIGVELPVFSELHLKVACRDDRRAIPRDAPLLIWADPQRLAWTSEEQALLAESPETARLLGELPEGVHARPEGRGDSTTVLLLWPYHTPPVEPVLPLPVDAAYAEVVLRGMATMIPALTGYLDRLPRAVVDGGYYTKTRENRPLIGPLPVEGAFVIGALSGFGQMASGAAGELLAAHVTGEELPGHAPTFRLDRYQDPAYRALLEAWGTSGQL